MNPHPVFLAQDRDPQMRAACYRARLREGVGEDELASISAHLEQDRALGDAKFQAMIEKALGRPAAPTAPRSAATRRPPAGRGLIPSVPFLLGRTHGAAMAARKQSPERWPTLQTQPQGGQLIIGNGFRGQLATGRLP